MQFQLSNIIQNPKLLADVSEHELDKLIQLHPTVALFRLEKYKKNKNDAQLAQTSFYLANRNILYQLDYSNKETSIEVNSTDTDIKSSIVEANRTDANNESDNILAQIDNIANKEDEITHTITTTEEPLVLIESKNTTIEENIVVEKKLSTAIPTPTENKLSIADIILKEIEQLKKERQQESQIISISESINSKTKLVDSINEELIIDEVVATEPKPTIILEPEVDLYIPNVDFVSNNDNSAIDIKKTDDNSNIIQHISIDQEINTSNTNNLVDNDDNATGKSIADQILEEIQQIKQSRKQLYTIDNEQVNINAEHEIELVQKNTTDIVPTTSDVVGNLAEQITSEEIKLAIEENTVIENNNTIVDDEESIQESELAQITIEETPKLTAEINTITEQLPILNNDDVTSKKEEMHTFLEWLNIVDHNFEKNILSTSPILGTTTSYENQFIQENKKEYTQNILEGETDTLDEIDENVNKLADESISFKNELATETLAIIFTKQEKYDKAIQVYEKLILKYPEKSSKFATQIEKIKKLI